MEGTAIIMDGTVVFGRTQKEHDKHIQLLFERCRRTRFRLNPAKLMMGLNALTFMGHRITSKGIKVDP